MQRASAIALLPICPGAPFASWQGQPRARLADVTTRQPTEALSSFVLLQRARAGDSAAEEQLFARYLPRLQRWAHGRLPWSARGALETDDLVQDTLLHVLRRLDDFEPRHEGAFLAYLCTALRNRIRDQVRRAKRLPEPAELRTDNPSREASPLEEAVGQETLERYEAALQRLRETDRELILLRVELGLEYPEIADAVGKPSVSAAQMAVSRALVRLAREMSVD